MFTDNEKPKLDYDIVHQNGFDIIINNTADPVLVSQAKSIALGWGRTPDPLLKWTPKEFIFPHSSEFWIDNPDNPKFVLKKRWITLGSRELTQAISLPSGWGTKKGKLHL